MDEKEVQLFAKAKAFLYENAPAKFGIAWKASFALDETENPASGKDGKSA